MEELKVLVGHSEMCLLAGCLGPLPVILCVGGDGEGAGEQPASGPPSLLLKLGAHKRCSPCVYRPSPPAGMAEPEAQAAT